MTNQSLLSLIVGLPFQPIARAEAAEQELPALVIDKDEDGERDGWEPPSEVEGIHAKTLVHSRGVAEEGSQSSFKEYAKVHHPVLHSLLEDRVLPGFADDQVSPLDNYNRHKEGCVTSKLEGLPIIEVLSWP